MKNAGPDMALEAGCARPVCGIDEAGRGAWAGPVVAAAVILGPDMPDGLNDSKKLSPAAREHLLTRLERTAEIGIGLADVGEIETLNILAASHLAMCRAVAALPRLPAHALVDGHLLPPHLGCEATAVIGGDGRSTSIAAASIVAKVTRDRIMVAYSQQYPGYGWDRNAGYGVPAHKSGLLRLGVTPIHRRSYKPIHNILCQQD